MNTGSRVERAVVLLSGGMDSTTLLHMVRIRLGAREVRALSFSYGQKHSKELDMARLQATAAGVAEHRVLDIGFMREVAAGSALTDPSVDVPRLDDIPGERLRQPPTYVPNRNMILLSIAAAYAESRGIADLFYGAQAQDEYGYWDCTVDFVDRINHLLRLNRANAVTVHAPFVGRSKAEIVRVGLKLGVDFARTWSCYRGADRPCRECPSCVERDAAFRKAGAEDPLNRTAGLYT